MFHIKPVHDLSTIKRLARYYGVAKKSHYEVLNLSKNCTDKEIKSAFVTLSKELHPDKNKSPNAQEMFVAVVEAYNVLGKPSSRAQYDRLMERPPIKTYTVYRYEAPKKDRESKRNDKTNKSFSENSFRHQQTNHFYNDYTQHSWSRDESTNKKESRRANSSYYGVDGVAKVPNYIIIMACLAITVVGTMFQIFVIRELYVVHKKQALEKSRYLSEELDKVRAAAQVNTNDMQTQILLEKIVNAAHPTVATASLGQSLVEEPK